MVQGVGWFAVLHALLGHRLPYLVVLVLVYVVAIPLGFVLYRGLVFGAGGPWLVDLGRFTVVQGGAFAINLGALPFFHELLHVPVVLAQALSIGLVLVFNYTGHLYFSFRRRDSRHDTGSGDTVETSDAAARG